MALPFCSTQMGLIPNEMIVCVDVRKIHSEHCEISQMWCGSGTREALFIIIYWPAARRVNDTAQKTVQETF